MAASASGTTGGTGGGVGPASRTATIEEGAPTSSTAAIEVAARVWPAEGGKEGAGSEGGADDVNGAGEELAWASETAPEGDASDGDGVGGAGTEEAAAREIARANEPL